MAKKSKLDIYSVQSVASGITLVSDALWRVVFTWTRIDRELDEKGNPCYFDPELAPTIYLKVKKHIRLDFNQ